MVKNPINNGIFIILGGAGFCPSTVYHPKRRIPWKKTVVFGTAGQTWNHYPEIIAWFLSYCMKSATSQNVKLNLSIGPSNFKPCQQSNCLFLLSFRSNIWEFPKKGVPQNGWFIIEHPIKNDDLEVYPYFWKQPYKVHNLPGMCCFFVFLKPPLQLVNFNSAQLYKRNSCCHLSEDMQFTNICNACLDLLKLEKNVPKRLV